ncbi:MAG: hypothetical protein M3N06_06030 [Pseudomonadota bacterium]|nr:hypothetical protein [Pseudomonadota bacterium]
MSTVSDILQAIQRVMLIESRVDHLDASVISLGHDVKETSTGLHDLSLKVALIEGFIQGRTSAPTVKRLPKRAE